jgi:flagellar hook-basal body complex protein FliE
MAAARRPALSLELMVTLARQVLDAYRQLTTMQS